MNPRMVLVRRQYKDQVWYEVIPHGKQQKERGNPDEDVGDASGRNSNLEDLSASRSVKRMGV